MPHAYPIIDHVYDVVVVGAGGAGSARDPRHDARGAQDRLHHQGLPDPQPHRRGAGRHRRRARQYGRGRLALAHVRHGQGVGLARRPGRDRIYVPRGDPGGDRARAFRRAVLAHRGRADLSAAVRRPQRGLRRGRWPSAPAPPPTAPATPSSTRSTSSASSTTPSSSSSISRSTSSWTRRAPAAA